jgi:hypothetical protein
LTVMRDYSVKFFLVKSVNFTILAILQYLLETLRC